MFQKRNRLLNFRLTEEEFARLKTASDLRGARCLSDYARTAMLGSLDPSANHDTANSDQVTAFDLRLARLESSMAQLIDALANLEAVKAKAESSRR